MKCICGNEKDYEACCGVIISGIKAAVTPEELMRSRYSAYVQGDGRYLVLSAIKENRHDEDVELIQEFSNSVQWLKLDVLNAKDDTVEFKAYYREKEGIKVLHEKSRFIQDGGVWYYADGELYNSKVERNESCPCASGKKFKKCCG
ncbi:YchJ family protein [bacterium]|nr:YchJ family protein [bacterium]MBU1990796.1 YchJ family protein [bacterium]